MKKINTILFLLVTFVFFVFKNNSAATYYWVGGDGVWNDPSHWSLNLLEPRTPANTIPGTNDNAVFDSISGLGNYYVTIPYGNIYVRDFIVRDLGNNGSRPSIQSPLSLGASSDSLFISGSLIIPNPDIAGDWSYYGVTVFKSLESNRIRFSQDFIGDIVFEGNSGVWTIDENFYLDLNTYSLTLKSGTLNIFEDIYNIDKFRFQGGTLVASHSEIIANEFLLFNSDSKTLNLQNSRLILAQRWDASLGSNINIFGNYEIIAVDPMHYGSHIFDFLGNNLTYDLFIIGEGVICNMSGENIFNEIYIESYSHDSYLNLADNITLSTLFAEGGPNNNIYINGENGVKTITKTGSEKVCLHRTYVNDLNAIGGDFYVYDYDPGNLAGWTFVSASYPKSISSPSAYPYEVCKGGLINLNSSGPIGDYTYEWSYNNTVLGQSANLTNISAPLQKGINYFDLKITHTVTGCYTIDYNSYTYLIMPEIEVSPSDTVICPGNTISINAVARDVYQYSYAWSPTNAISGTPFGYGYSHTVSTQPLSSSVTFTVVSSYYASQNTCYDTTLVNVTVDTHSISAISPSSPSVCIGSSVSLTAQGSGRIFNWSQSPTLNTTKGATVLANPTQLTTYSVSSCVNTKSVIVVVNPLPTINAGLDVTVCRGVQTQFGSATGASTYTWSPSSGLQSTIGSSVLAAPNISRNYVVTGRDANGCTNTDEIRFNVIQAQLKAMATYSGGNITSTTPETFTKLYLDRGPGRRMLEIDSLPIGSTGFVYNNLSSADSFIIAIHTDTAVYRRTLRTYYNNAFQWSQANRVRPECNTTTTYSVQVKELSLETGLGSINGKVIEGQGFRTNKTDAAGDGIGGVELGLKKKPGGSLSMVAITDNNGNYSFGNVAAGEYDIHVEIPGLPVVSTYSMTIGSSPTTLENINFEADSNQIEKNLSSFIKEVKHNNSSLNVYPNPAGNQIKMSWTLTEESFGQIAVYDLLGKRVMQIKQEEVYSPGIYTQTVDITRLDNGTYYIKSIFNNSDSIFKLVIFN